MQTEIDASLKATADSSAHRHALESIAARIDASSGELFVLVELLGPTLTNSDPFVRSRGVGLLSDTLARLKPESVGTKAASVLLSFFLDRLHDTPSVGDALKGIFQLLSLECLPKLDVLEIPKRIFDELSVQDFQQTVRHSVLRIFDYLLSNHADGLSKAHKDFVGGFIQCIDGEKDPRNLMLSFRSIKSILRHMDIAGHTEDLFEVVSCYFPITFRPPPDDIYGITADDLRLGLRECITGSFLFGPLAVPFLLEKLSSSSISAKRDSMEALVSGAATYGSECLVPHTDRLWQLLSEEVFHASNDELQTAALDALKAISQTLSLAATTNKQDAFGGLLKEATDKCLGYLKDPDHKFAKGSGRIIACISATSDPANQFIVSQAMPVLLEWLKTEERPVCRKVLMDVLLQLLVASRELYGTSGSTRQVDGEVEFPVLAYKDRLLEVFRVSAILASEYAPVRLVSIKALLELALHLGCLAEIEIRAVVQLWNSLITGDVDVEIYNEAVQAIVAVSDSRADIVLELSVSPLLALLRDTHPQNYTHNTKLYLEALTKESIRPDIFDVIVPGLIRILNEHLELESGLPFTEDVIDAIAAVLRTHAEDETADNKADVLKQCVDSVVKPMFRMLVVNSLVSKQTLAASLVHKLSSILGLVVRELPLTEQSEVASFVYRIFIESDIEAVVSDQALRATWRPLSPLASPSQRVLVQPLASVACCLRSTVPLPGGSEVQFVKTLVQPMLDASEATVDEATAIWFGSLAQIAATIINKGADEKASETLCADVKQQLWALISAGTGSMPQRQHLILVYGWLTKGLVIKSSKLGYEMARDLLALIENQTLGLDAARALSIVVKESDDSILTKKAFCTVKPLYKQRLFAEAVPKISSGFNASGPGAKSNYLVALSYFLSNAPKQVLLGALPSLVPLIIPSLESADSTLKLSTLATLQSMLKDVPDLVTTHLSTFVPLLLKLTQVDAEQTNKIPVRVGAIRCIGMLPSALAYSDLHPFKPVVLSGLAPALDDTKRAVRKEAANSRNKWYLLTGPKKSN
ncbi:Dos2-interacting transcription regulator of RNA-Pol-II-domain-containing protein [Polychytrium aggregatum]|uniref:Dos2-interacting transcription regulator of RNA-Pol-II-domain-containing protein n=1 Tax=Polychytrium aggregatum TaxID=110093 RepID=UPI0022FE3B86|nr:Dos2-interacting transcription regulator of RNA-Pol-II-domain-containing protein [Polychytrium aggregatum]KAI9205008.1 Dos2-interacting transcription regulator of RNA-Pol-II-domain-containing protein [Polychytrium aggregatum]